MQLSCSLPAWTSPEDFSSSEDQRETESLINDDWAPRVKTEPNETNDNDASESDQERAAAVPENPDESVEATISIKFEIHEDDIADNGQATLDHQMENENRVSNVKQESRESLPDGNDDELPLSEHILDETQASEMGLNCVKEESCPDTTPSHKVLIPIKREKELSDNQIMNEDHLAQREAVTDTDTSFHKINKLHNCTQCNKKFSTQIQLLNHQCSHWRNEIMSLYHRETKSNDVPRKNSPSDCKLCHEVVQMKHADEFIRHLARKHDFLKFAMATPRQKLEQNIERQPAMKHSSKSNTSSKASEYQCLNANCNKIFRYHPHAMEHVATMHNRGAVLARYNHLTPRTSLDASHTKRIAKCKLCAENFEDRSRFFAHLHRRHKLLAKEEIESQILRIRSSSPAKCEICSVEMSSPAALRAHEIKMHYRERIWELYDRAEGLATRLMMKNQCKICGKQLRGPTGFLGHLGLSHKFLQKSKDRLKTSNIDE